MHPPQGRTDPGVISPHFWILLEDAVILFGFYFTQQLVHITPTPTHGSNRGPGFLAKPETQTLGETPAKLHFKQPWSRRAMRLEELPDTFCISRTALHIGTGRWTRANTSNSLFFSFQAVKTNRSIAPVLGRNPFPPLLSDFLK